MSELNLYWPVYKNLEKEVLKIADYIHFSDDQTKVYSIHIADLIVRCSIEIESISKELYLKLDGNENPINDDGSKRDLYFDTDCLELLERNWKLSKKQVMISATTFYFVDEKNKVLSPLYKANKRGSSGSKWKQAYQAVKHSRKVSLKKATIENLLHAMGSLYILNLYYRDEIFDIGRVYMGTSEFDNCVGSDIFSVFTFNATTLAMAQYMNDSCISELQNNNFDKSIYIVKYDDKSFKEMHESFCKDNIITLSNFENSPEIAKFLSENPSYTLESINKTCIDAGGINLLTKIMSFTHTMKNRDAKTEAIINKHTNIYPELLPIEDKKL